MRAVLLLPVELLLRCRILCRMKVAGHRLRSLLTRRHPALPLRRLEAARAR